MKLKSYRGEHVYLRPFQLTDVDDVVAWLNNEENWAALGRSNPLDGLRDREFVKGLRHSATDVALGICAQNDAALVGCCGLHAACPQARRSTLGLLIGECRAHDPVLSAEAIGLAVRFGFEELNLNRIELSVYAGSERGLRAYRGAGFVQEGRLRQAHYRNGKYHDLLQLAILRDDWERTLDDDADAFARLSSMST